MHFPVFRSFLTDLQASPHFWAFLLFPRVLKLICFLQDFGDFSGFQWLRQVFFTFRQIFFRVSADFLWLFRISVTFGGLSVIKVLLPLTIHRTYHYSITRHPLNPSSEPNWQTDRKWCIWVMLKIMKPTKNSTPGTSILLWHVLHRKNEAGPSKWVFIFHVSWPLCHTLASLFSTWPIWVLRSTGLGVLSFTLPCGRWFKKTSNCVFLWVHIEIKA